MIRKPTVPALIAFAAIAVGGAALPANAQPERLLAATLIHDAQGRPGLRLSEAAVKILDIKIAAAERVTKPEALPPLVGTIQYDTDRLFIMRSRFTGEIVQFRQVADEADAATPQKVRPVRFGDRVKQGDLLAVVFSAELGKAKAALVDALLNLRISQELLQNHRALFEQGGIPLAVLRASERQEQADRAAAFKAERGLRFMKLTDQEIDAVKIEAKTLGDAIRKNKDFRRDAKAEAEKWSRVEIRVPRSSDDPIRELVIVEKNASIGDIIEPIASPPLFKVADLKQLQVVARLPQEYLGRIRMERGMLTAPVEEQAHAHEQPLNLRFRIGPSAGEAPMTTMVANLDNPTGSKYVVGQFVKVQLFVPPQPAAVAVPAAALHEARGQTAVFVQPDPAKREYLLRRVAVVERFRDVVWVRSQLTAAAPKQGKQLPEALAAGEHVAVRGVAEMAAQLNDLLANAGTAPKK